MQPDSCNSSKNTLIRGPGQAVRSDVMSGKAGPDKGPDMTSKHGPGQILVISFLTSSIFSFERSQTRAARLRERFGYGASLRK
jgi:hypothetical protein